MKALIAMDSFKGSLSSIEVSEAIAAGLRDVKEQTEILMLPLADGGEGTTAALVEADKGSYITTTVTGPLHQRVDAVYGMIHGGKTAVIEVAAACGLPLVPLDKRNPFHTTTYGVGEMIVDAMERGCREFIIGLGGSATNDAGVGMLQALGIKFLDQDSCEVEQGGYALQSIRKIDTENAHPLLEACSFNIACDVTNPLYGKNGAAYIFGPQKGAAADMIEVLDQGLQNVARLILEDYHIDMQQTAGAGAAGGLGAAFVAFLNGKLQSGSKLILEAVNMEAQIQGCDFVITGEGKLDSQTSMGKAPLAVAELADKHAVPVIALAGGVTKEASQLNAKGLTSYFSIVNEPMNLEQAMNPKTSYENLRVTASQVYRLIQAVNTPLSKSEELLRE